MSLLFYGAAATNGYNADGHYVRLAPIVGPCTAYARRPIAGCSANFSGASSASAAIAGEAVSEVMGDEDHRAHRSGGRPPRWAACFAT